MPHVRWSRQNKINGIWYFGDFFLSRNALFWTFLIYTSLFCLYFIASEFVGLFLLPYF